MKKIIMILLSVLLLVACSNDSHYSHISDGDEVIFTGPGITYTKNDLYKTLKLSSSDAIETDIINKISTKYDLDIEAAKKDAQDYIDTYLMMGYGDALIASYGSIDACIQILMSESILRQLANVYVEENFEEISAKQKATQMQYAYFQDEETALQVIEEVKNGATFDMAALNHGYEYAANTSVYLDTDGNLPLVVREFLYDNQDFTGLSDVLVNTSKQESADGEKVDNNTYYVLNVNSRNIQDFKDDYIEIVKENVAINSVKSYFFNKHEIEFFDQDIYEMMSEKYEAFQ